MDLNPRHGQRYRDLLALKSGHPAVRRLRRAGHKPALHGNKQWRSSFVLMDWLAQSEPPAGPVLDLGCGWGLLSTFVARHFGIAACGVDADPAVAPFFHLQAQMNGVECDFLERRFAELGGEVLTAFPCVIGADICFWDDMAQELAQLVDRAIDVGVETVLIADPGRPPFWEFADHCAVEYCAEVFSHRIESPWPTEKWILQILNA